MITDVIKETVHITELLNLLLTYIDKKFFTFGHENAS